MMLNLLTVLPSSFEILFHIILFEFVCIFEYK